MKKYLIGAAVIAAFVVLLFIQYKKIVSLSAERDVYQHNTEVLMQDVRTYQTKDSLNAIQVESLGLKIKEFEKLRADDAKLIKSLRIDKRDLQSVVTAQAQTIIEMGSPVRDTVIISESHTDTVQVIHYRSEWTDLDGMIDKDKNFTCKIYNRDSIMVATTVQYKRFLGFLWKTKQIKSRQVDIVSKNPNTSIIGSEFIEIER